MVPTNYVHIWHKIFFANEWKQDPLFCKKLSTINFYVPRKRNNIWIPLCTHFFLSCSRWENILNDGTQYRIALKVAQRAKAGKLLTFDKLPFVFQLQRNVEAARTKISQNFVKQWTNLTNMPSSQIQTCNIIQHRVHTSTTCRDKSYLKLTLPTNVSFYLHSRYYLWVLCRIQNTQKLSTHWERANGLFNIDTK